MRLYFDLDKRQLVGKAGYPGKLDLLEFKRGDATTIELVFVRGTVRELLGGTNEIRFAIKEPGKYDADPVVFLDAWVEGADSYTGSPNFNTIEINALLANDGDDSNDIAYVNAMLEITFTRDNGATWTSSNTITARINNDVVRGDEGVPVAGAPAYPTAEKVLGIVGVPIADAATAYALTGVAVGTVYKTDDTGVMMEYLGGGEATPSNWLQTTGLTTADQTKLDTLDKINPITSIHEAYATETNNVIAGTIYKTTDFDQLLEKLDVIPHIEQSFNVSDAGTPADWVGSESLASLYVWDGTSYKGEGSNYVAEVIFNTDHWELRTMSSSNFNSPTCTINDHPADVVGAWTKVHGSATGSIADGAVTVNEPRNWKHTSVSTREVFNALSPFTLTNTGGGNLQTNDTIPKLWDWEAILTGSPSAAPEFYSGGSGAVDLTTLVLGSKVTEIGQAEFLNCSNLVGTIVFPDSCTIIGSDQSYGSGNGAFVSCAGITGLVFGAGLVTLFENEFEGCTAITSIGFNEGLTTIGARCFNSCSAIRTMTLPSTLTTAGSDCFKGCDGLRTVVIPESLTAIPHGMFEDCEGLVSVTLPSTLATMGTHAFASCDSLTSIHIPASLTAIPNNAFQSCLVLASVTFEEGLLTIGNSAFDTGTTVMGGFLIDFPSTLTAIGDNAFNHSASGLKFAFTSMKEGLLTIGDFAFYDGAPACDPASIISIPSTVTSIGIAGFASSTCVEFYTAAPASCWNADPAATPIAANGLIYVKTSELAGYGGIGATYNTMTVTDWTSYPAEMP